MQRVIHGPNTSHFFIAKSVTNLARLIQEFDQLQKALVMHEQSLVMKCAIYGTDGAHPESVYLFRDLSNVHALLGSVRKANHYQEKSSEMSRVIHDCTSATAQPDLAANNNEATEMRVSSEEG